MSISFDLDKFYSKLTKKDNTDGKKSAFTTAEMLIVLLIVAFLIIAMPPVVNKKIEKKLRRGEHGRYECFINPTTGQLTEYLATERGGASWGPNGRVVAAGDRCRFKPQEMASTASYFVVQMIGGGGGGAFPPYNSNEHYRRVTDDSNIVQILRQPEHLADDGGALVHLHSGSIYFNTKLTYAHDVDSGSDYMLDGTYTDTSDTRLYYGWPKTGSTDNGKYVSGTLKFRDCPKKRWIYEYFPPVTVRYTTGQPIRICSGHGARGMSRVFRSNSLQDPVEVDDGNGNTITLSTATFWGDYGHRGGFGYCIMAGNSVDNLAGEVHYPEPCDKDDLTCLNTSDTAQTDMNNNIAMGREESDYFKITTNSFINSYDYALYYTPSYTSSTDFKLLSYVDFTYDPLTITSATDSEGGPVGTPPIHGPNTSGTDVTLQYASGHTAAVMCPYTGQTGTQRRTPYENVAGYNMCNTARPIPYFDAGSLGAYSGTIGTFPSICNNVLDQYNMSSSFGTETSPNAICSTVPGGFSSDRWPKPDLNSESLLPDKVFYNSKMINNSDYMDTLDMGLTIEAKHYNYATGLLENANCELPGGRNAEDVDLNTTTLPPLSKISVNADGLNDFGDITYNYIVAQGNCRTGIWKNHGANDGVSGSVAGGYAKRSFGRKITYPQNAWFNMPVPLTYRPSGVHIGQPFPTKIAFTRTSTDYSTTYGFGGRPGEAIGLSYANLTGTLEFEIGAGGNAGTAVNIQGGTGGNTVIWRKAVGASDSLDCSTEANANNASCSRMAIAQGGLGYSQGAVGNTISLRGNRSCGTRDNDGNWFIRIDGCLDAGAGPKNQNSLNGGNSLRFAEDSDFYIVPELEDNSTTRSLLEAVYDGLNMPGSGGDGGYTFLYRILGGSTTDLTNVGDAEQVSAPYHTNFTPDSMRLIGAGEWFTVTPGTLRTTPDTTAYNGNTDNQFGGYRCYTSTNLLPSSGHGGTGNIPVPFDNRTGLCNPQNGNPGAVVIVW